MIFQEPMTALNPMHTIGHQVAEPLRRHKNYSAAQAREEAIALLDRVGLPDAAKRVDAYPHQFSGGQRQRVTIAMALACQPDLLIADEPTTALDVTIQGQILDLIADLVEERGMAMILISHDLGVIAENVQRMMVMYGGTVVESGATDAGVLAAWAIPIRRACSAPARGSARAKGTRLTTIAGTVPELADLPGRLRLRRSLSAGRGPMPRGAAAAVEVGGGHRVRCMRTDVSMAAAARGRRMIARCKGRDAPLLEVKDLVQRYALPRENLFGPPAQVRALNGVSVQVQAGQSLGIVGESGSGKSTFARLVMALERPTSGPVDAARAATSIALLPDELRRARRDFQMVFQDPYGSLDPRQTVARIVAEPLTVLDDARSQPPCARASPRCCGRSACATPTWTNIRTNSPADSASASRLRAR